MSESDTETSSGSDPSDYESAAPEPSSRPALIPPRRRSSGQQPTRSSSTTFREQMPNPNTIYHPTLSRRSTQPDLDGDQRPSFPNPELNLDTRRQNIIAMDRKRRLTNSEHEHYRRQSPQDFRARRHSNRRVSNEEPPLPLLPSTPESNTRTQPDVVDLTGSVSPPIRSVSHRHRRPRRTSSSSSRRYVVPRWQPDSEVSECPICKRPFTFMFRRHHCRKCGRVVCGDCSPHRITIPRPFIVNPPGPDFLSSNIEQSPRSRETIDLTRDEEENATSSNRPRPGIQSLLEGGEKVRLCNPCVPDPQPEPSSNMPPFLQDNTGRAPLHSPFTSFASTTSPFGAQQSNLHSQGGRYGSFSANQRPPSGSLSSSRPHLPTMPHPYSAYYPDHRFQLPPTFNPTFGGPRHRNDALPPLPPFGPHPPSIYGHGRFLSQDLPTRSQHDMPNRPRGSSLFEPQQRPSMISQSLPHSGLPIPRAPRPRVREEDACPICRCELPPKGVNGDETAREAHIMACITAREPSSNAGGNETGSSSRGILHMISFTASEKDCLAEDGNTQECSICMVEYDVGDKLARLECFCKFHKECIVSWLNRKSECPVHKASRMHFD